MSTIQTTLWRPPVRFCRIPSRSGLVAAVLCVAGADLLFWGHPVGVSLVVFLSGLAVVTLLGNPIGRRRGNGILALAVLVAGLLPLIEDVNGLSILFGVSGTALFAQILVSPPGLPWATRLGEARTLLLSGPCRLMKDGDRLFPAATGGGRSNPMLRVLANWCVPIVCLALFLALFASANPLIEGWFADIDIGRLAALASPWRILFWLSILVAVRPLIPVPLRRNRPAPPAASPAATDPHGFLGEAAVVRSLVLFNGVFALQTGLDLAYLWGGAALPDGMSYAAYAHRGAYPLVVTALLAAGFVLVAMRPGGPAGHSRLIPLLVLVWIGQNILLVISSIRRLELYVAACSLTELRLAAMIWMMLVVIGLVLITVRIVCHRPAGWLVAANGRSVMLAFYLWCVVDSDGIIAGYNVAHSAEIDGEGPNLDVGYLAALGPAAIPAMDDALRRLPAGDDAHWLSERRTALATAFRADHKNWRTWSFRAWRLKRYMATIGAVTPVRPNDPWRITR